MVVRPILVSFGEMPRSLYYHLRCGLEWTEDMEHQIRQAIVKQELKVKGRK